MERIMETISGAHYPSDETFPNVSIVDLSTEATPPQRADAYAIARDLDVLGQVTKIPSHIFVHHDGTMYAWICWDGVGSSLIECGAPRTVKRSVQAVRTAFRVLPQVLSAKGR